jgi:hypothetical protein
VEPVSGSPSTVYLIVLLVFPFNYRSLIFRINFVPVCRSFRLHLESSGFLVCFERPTTRHWFIRVFSLPIASIFRLFDQFNMLSRRLAHAVRMVHVRQLQSQKPWPALLAQQARRYADISVKVPQMAESISEGTLKQFSKQVGDFVEQDEEIATIETDKVFDPSLTDCFLVAFG